MSDERRSARRARLTGVRVSYESSTGAVQEADVANLSREGLFITSATPVPVGKRLSLEIHVTGEAAPWAALGRVVWNRAVSEGAAIPGGMAVKFIDVDDAVVAAIDRLIEARERTEPGLGDGAAAPAGREPPRREEPRREPPRREPPRRERTMIGVGIAGSSPVTPDAIAAPGRAIAAAPSPAAPAAPASAAPADRDRSDAAAPAPAARAMPSRERTIVGVGLAAAGADPREPSLPIDLVARKPPSARPPPASSEPPVAAAEDTPTRAATEEAPTRTATETPTRDAIEATPVRAATGDALAQVGTEATPTRATKARAPASSEEPVEPRVSEPPVATRRSGGGWLLVLLLVAGGVAGYAFRDRLLPLWYIAANAIARRLR
jgi:uncharacterized protein (TIGR02266 family)